MEEGGRLTTRIIFNPPEGDETTNDVFSSLLLRPDLNRLRMAVAFASAEGAKLLLGAIEARSARLDVRLVVGLDGSITEPAAIRILSERLPNRVRLFETTGPGMFHAKTLVLDRRGRSSPFVLIVGSANLTSAGFLRNREAGAVVELGTGSERDRISAQWHEWFQEIWKRSSAVTPTRIRAYETHRKNSPQLPSPDRVTGGETEESTVAIGRARELWIESGAITGGSANQLEIPGPAVPFFGVNPIDHATRAILRLSRGSSVWNGSVMSYYGRNGMWRINLDTSIPEVNRGEVRYRVLRFRRRASGDGFDFSVLSSAQTRAAQAASRATANIGSTGQRSYGWV